MLSKDHAGGTEGIAVRKMLRLTGLMLLAMAVLLIVQSRPAAPEQVERLAVAQSGVIRPAGRAVIDLNRADEALLSAIPGVGPVLAARIRAYVLEKGALTAPEELLDVEGVGPAKLREIERMAAIG